MSLFLFVINRVNTPHYYTMIINYANREITLKFTFRADMLFEDALGRTFKGESISDNLKYMFCNIVALTKDESLKFDDFVEWISDNEQVYYDYMNWYTQYQLGVLEKRGIKIDQQPDQQPEKSKKKVSRSKKK